jgi:hypothetical protein
MDIYLISLVKPQISVNEWYVKLHYKQNTRNVSMNCKLIFIEIRFGIIYRDATTSLQHSLTVIKIKGLNGGATSEAKLQDLEQLALQVAI